MSVSRLLMAILIVVSCFVQTAPTAPRTWTDKTGRANVDAELVNFTEEHVWLRRSDGEVFRVHLDELSPSDREYVLGVASGRQSQDTPETARKPGRIPYGRPRKLCELASPRIDESSGLACSRRHPGVFWTHNDSGDSARLYAFDLQGRDLGSCELSGVQAFDWEDIVSFERDGKCYLLVCDVGNNGLASAVQILHLVEEPPVDAEQGVTVEQVPVLETIHFSYDDDHRNCEAVAVDPTDRTMVFASKERDRPSHVYTLPWPDPDPRRAFTARSIGVLDLPEAVTAMDISPDGTRAIVLTYLNAYEYVRRPGEDWGRAFSRKPREIVMPGRIQGESICYGGDGQTLYLTSEKLPTPLWEVPVEEQ